jgi:alkylation response protein AidB-like acyl-CoA dehydrogenase
LLRLAEAFIIAGPSRGRVHVRVKWEAFVLDFSLNEEQRLLKQSVRDFAEKEIAPHAREWDAKQEFPREVFTKLGELGLMGVVWPADYGGAGPRRRSTRSSRRRCRAPTRASRSTAAHNSLCSGHIFRPATRTRRRSTVPLARGEKVGWGAHRELRGLDAGGTSKTTAVRDGDHWRANGSKTFITNAQIADTAVVMAVTDRSKGKKGISAFIVERGTKGFRPGKKEDKLGVRSSDTSELILEDVRVPVANLLGREGNGFVDTLRILDRGRIGIAAWSVGIGQASLEAAMGYASGRRQFGHAISEFQAIQFKIADMATDVDAARLLTWRAAALRDSGQEHTAQSSMAKLFASEMAVRVALDAVQIHGGYGFIQDYPVERYLRDSCRAHRQRAPARCSGW